MTVLKTKRAEGTYISTVIFVLIAVIFIGLIINLFSIIAAKSQMDAAADQLTRQIQLAGEVNSDTDHLFSDITGHISAAENIQYSVSTHYLTGKKIQLATPFSVTVTGTADRSSVMSRSPSPELSAASAADGAACRGGRS